MADPANTGIYEIVNLVNGKRYVGSAKFLSKRRGQHWTRLRNGWHHNRKLQNSWNKHGESNFEFRVLLCCRTIDLLFFEQKAIDVLHPELNICPTAGSTLGRLHSEETRAKIAAKKVGLKLGPRSAEHRAALSRAQKGRRPDPVHLEKFFAGRRAFVRTQDQCAAVSTAMKLAWERGDHRRDRSPEYRAKISVALKGIKHSEERRAKQAAGQLGLKRKPYNIKPKTAEQKRRG
jgi:group I intron endonuclease